MSGAAKLLADVLPAEALGAGDPAEWAVGGRVPEAVSSPGTAEEVRGVLAVAADQGLGVIPMGGRTTLGPEPPSLPFVALSTARLAGVEEYEPADLTVTAGAGTSLALLGRALAAEGQWLPVDPPFAPRRTVGGVVATGSAGFLGMAYGAPRDHVLGLTVVTGDGRLLRLGGKVMKNVAGFDLVKLMVGSRGTLGVVLSATMRLFPQPAEDRVLVVAARAPGALLPLAQAVATATVVPASAVLLFPSPLPLKEKAGAALVVRVQGGADSVAADARRLLGAAEVDAVHLSGGECAGILDAVRDHAARGSLVVRASAPPGLLPEVLAALNEAMPGSAVAADVMSGRVRGALGPMAAADESADADPHGLLRLRARLEGLGGSLTLQCAEPEVLASVPALGDAGRAGALGSALRARFDPGGVLSPGRFVG